MRPFQWYRFWVKMTFLCYRACLILCRSVQGGVYIPPFSLLSIGLSLNQERTYSWPGPVLGIRIRYKTGGEGEITCRHHRSKKNFSFQQCLCPDNIISNLAICIYPSLCFGSVPLWYPKSPTLFLRLLRVCLNGRRKTWLDSRNSYL